jgi:intraflagellar transport protein 172
MWEDCLRVAKVNGSKAELNELARGWVNSLPKDQQISKLISMGLTEAAIDIYIQNKDFENAFKLAEQHEKYKIPEIHLKYAYELETEKRYQQAEDHYIKANNVQEAIQMYEHIGDFYSALRIARQHDQASVFNIYFNQKPFVYVTVGTVLSVTLLSQKNEGQESFFLCTMRFKTLRQKLKTAQLVSL